MRYPLLASHSDAITDLQVVDDPDDGVPVEKQEGVVVADGIERRQNGFHAQLFAAVLPGELLSCPLLCEQHLTVYYRGSLSKYFKRGHVRLKQRSQECKLYLNTIVGVEYPR